MNTIDRKYLNIIEDILIDGVDVQTRNSKVRKKFNITTEYNSTPLVSVRKTAWKQAIREFEWFMSGSNNINDLHESVRHWWSPWVDKSGYINYGYGQQFRSSMGIYHNGRGFDQIEYLINNLKNDSQSRRNAISTWNTNDMASPMCPITNCHGSLIQTDVNPETNELSLFMYQRSADVMLGVPHNMIQYFAFLLYLSSQACYKPGKLIHTLGNAHIYDSHLDMAHRFMETAISNIETPQLTYTPTSDKFKADDFTLDGDYNPLIKESLELIV